MRVLMWELQRTTALGSALGAALARHAIEFDRVRSQGQFDAALDSAAYDCIVLQAAAAAENGGPPLPDVLRGLPLIVVAAADDAAQRIAWLEHGADDAVAPDVDPAELAARVAVAIRREQHRSAPPLIVHGPLTLDPSQRSATWHGDVVTLTQKEYALLDHLVRGARQVHTRDALHEALGGDAADRNSNAVDVHVHALRSKFGASLIRTIRGAGYRINDAAVLLSK
jgi:DNA-binding response OmpR family regulator